MIESLRSRPRLRRWATFLIGGGLNTGITWLVFAGLTQVLAYQIAYAAAYATGVFFSYIFNAKFVFRTPLAWISFVAYPLVYVVQYLGSAGILAILIEGFGIPRLVAPLLVVIFMLPLTYLASRSVLRFTQRR